MMTIGLLGIIVVVAVGCVLLGMAISHSNSRKSESHQASLHTHERRARRSSNGWGWVVGIMLGIPLLLGLFLVVGWVSYESSPKSSQTTSIGYAEPHAPVITTLPADQPALDQELSVQITEASGERSATGEIPPATNAVERANSEGETTSETAWESRSHSSVSSHTGSESAAATSNSEIRTVTSYHGPSLGDVPPQILLGSGLLSLALLIGAGVWIAHRRRHWSFSGAVHSTVGSLWVLPLLASVGWVGYLMWPHLSVEPLVRDTDYNPSQTEFHRLVDPENGKIETQDGFRLLSETSEMPEWVSDGITSHGGVLHVPVHGGLWPDQEEARHKAKQQAMRVIREDFVHTYPDAQQWRIDATLQDVHASVAEVEESKVFPFREEPMYRTHILVEVSDNVRGEMFKHWCPDLQKFRMTMLATFGGLLTLVCFAGGACLSLDMRTGGNYRRWLRTATVLVVVAGAAAAHGVLGSLWFQHSV